MSRFQILRPLVKNWIAPSAATYYIRRPGLLAHSFPTARTDLEFYPAKIPHIDFQARRFHGKAGSEEEKGKKHGEESKDDLENSYIDDTDRETLVLGAFLMSCVLVFWVITHPYETYKEKVQEAQEARSQEQPMAETWTGEIENQKKWATD